MALNRTVCKDAFVEAMRERLTPEGRDVASNVDREDIQKNLDALGHAVFDILTIDAEAISSTAPATLKNFWVWINEVQAYLTALAAWQNALQTALDNFAGIGIPTAIDLQNELTPPIPSPPPPPLEAPSEILGKII